MNILRRSLLGRCLALFLLILSFLIIRTGQTFALSVNSLGDYDNIAVMEVSGDYSAIDENGDVNLLPRQEVSREYYNHHTDDYDFLVIFTNFDFPMPSAGTKAFFIPTKNDIEGLGLELYDATNLYSANGSFLNRLQGLVDMANVDSHVLEPTDPDFDKTLLTLTHEVLHRWGAYLTFIDDGQESDALLGLGNAHWSFLVDSQGSSLYGNHWQDNGDGTFTSVAPEQAQSGSYLGRVFSPLELYLMGLYEQQQVPPLMLIDSPGIDRNRLPEVGVTIPGSATTVTMEQIVSAMGERVPAAEADKTFRIAFLLLVNPDTWSAEDPESVRQLRLIRNLQIEWKKRFSILTKGTALLQTDLVKVEELETNPGVVPVTPGTHVAPHVNEGINWLLINQQGDGSWQDQPGSVQRDTATAVTALKPFPAGASGVVSGRSWLSDIAAENSDFLSRKLIGLDNVSLTEIEKLQNDDGGWGSAPGYRSNPVDSALVLKALTTHGSTNTTVVNDAIAYLHAVQDADGGWNSGLGSSMVQPTAYALLALIDYRDNSSYTLEPAIADGLAWLADRQNGDGGFGNGSSTVYDTAAALSVLKALGSAQAVSDGAINYVFNTQSSTGSWHNSVFQTAIAVQALYAATIQTDLQVEAVDISVSPFPVVSMPSDITISVMVWNHGEATASPVKVTLYQGEPSLGVIVGEMETSIPGHSFTSVDFPVHIATSADLEYFVSIDPDDLIEEVSNSNNIASRAFSAGVQPTVGFNLASSSGSESLTSVVIQVSLSHMWDQTVSVDLGINSSSTATAGADYNLVPGPLVFNPGETLKTMSVNIVNDVIPEGDESLILTLSNPTNATLSQAQTSYTILNDDVPPMVGFAISSGSGSEDVGPVTIPVVLSHAYPLDIRVNYTIDEAASEATSGEDVVLTAGTLLFPAGQTSGAIDMAIVNDTLEEPDELLVIKLSNPQEALLGTESFTYRILDNDAAPQVVITSPLNNETFTSGKITLQYQTNMPEENVAVYLNDVPVTTRDGQSLVIQRNGTYTIRVVATNINDMTAEDVISFVFDDSGTPPVMVWQRAGNIVRDSYHSSFDQLGYSEYGSLLVYGQNYDLAYEPVEKSFFARIDQYNNLQSSYGFPATWNLHTHLHDSVTTNDAYSLLEYFDSTRQYSIRTFSATTGSQLRALVVPHEAGLYSWQQFSIDSEGSLYVAGSTIEGIAKNASDDNGNIQLVKLDADGSQVWSQNYATGLTDTVVDIMVDKQDNLYLLGTTAGYLGQSGGVNAGGNDMFVIKIDTDGNTLWSRQWGTSMNDEARDLTLDNQGDVLLLGTTYGSFDGTLPTYAQDSFFIKLDKEGAEVWLKQDHSISSPRAIAVAPADEIVIAGGYGLYESGAVDYCQIRWSAYSKSGEIIWKDTLAEGSNRYDSNVSDLLIDETGNLFVTINWDPGYWSLSSTTLRKYKTNFELPAPFLTVDPYTYDPVTGSVFLSGRRLAGINVSLQTDSSIIVGPVDLSDTIRWAVTVSGIEPGQHTIIVKAVGSDGGVTLKDVVFDVALPTPFVVGTTRQYGTALDDVAAASAITNQDQLYIVGQEKLADSSGQDVSSWQTSVDGSLSVFNKIDMASIEIGKDVALDSNGNIYLAWNSDGNAYVRKYNPDSNVEWTGDYSSRKGEQTVEGVVVDADGNIYIVGCTTNSPDRNVSHGGGYDYFLTKFNSNGVYEWSRLAGPGHPGDQTAYGVAVDSTGNLYIVGHSQEMLHGVEVVNDSFIIKYDGQGTLLWVDAVGSSESGVARDIVIDVADNIYVVGETDLLGDQKTDGFIAKYRPDGLREWHEVFSTVSGRSEVVKDVDLDKDGNILITGYITGEPDDPEIQGSSDAFWVKYDVSGRMQWLERFGASFGDYPAGIHGTSLGTVVVTGYSGSSDYGDYDLFVREFNPVPPPELIIDQANSIINSRSFMLTGQVRPGAEVSIIVDAPVNSTAKVGVIILDQVSGTWSCLLTELVANDDNILTVVATDSYGSSSLPVIISVDTLPPELFVEPVISPTTQASQMIIGTIEIGATLTVEVNPPSMPLSVIVPADGHWIYEALLNAGDNDFTFVATDSVGHQTVKTASITSTAPPAMQVTLSRGSIGGDESTEVKLTITNLSNYADVLVEEVIDLNNNGLVDVGEPIIRHFRLEDELYSNDFNIQGDEALLNSQAAEGTIITTLNYHFVHDLYHVPGGHLFRVIDGTVEKIVLLEVVEAGYQQAVSGFVLDDMDKVLAGAVLRGINKWGQTVGYACSDTGGHYLLAVNEPGEYTLIPFAAGYVYDKSINQAISVGSGEFVSRNLRLTGISNLNMGLIWDRAQAHPIYGAMIRAENDRYIGSAWSNDTGVYELSLPEGTYDFYVDMFAAYGSSPQGYYSYEDPVLNVAVSDGSFIDNIELSPYQTTCLWTVRDQFNNVALGIPLKGIINDGSGMVMYAVSNDRGWYSIAAGLYPNTWQGEVSLNNDSAQVAGYVGNRFTFNPWDCSSKDLTIYAIDAWISGTVTDGNDTLFANVPVELTNASTGVVVAGKTTTDGAYQLGIHEGDWNVSIHAEVIGADPVAPEQINVTSGQTSVVNFTVTPLPMPVSVDINPVQSPTDTDSQAISGNVSVGAVVTVAVDTTATVGSISYPTGTSWECTISSLSEGMNNIIVTAAGGDEILSKVTMIDYQPAQAPNTIGITNATYASRKNTLTVDATSDYSDADLMVEYAGVVMPMNFEKLFKGKYKWSYTDTNVATAASTVTVSGPEGSVTEAVTVK